MMSKCAGLKMWATGFCGQSGFEAGTVMVVVVVMVVAVAVRVNLRRRPYFAQATRGSARLILGEREPIS